MSDDFVEVHHDGDIIDTILEHVHYQRRRSSVDNGTSPRRSSVDGHHRRPSVDAHHRESVNHPRRLSIDSEHHHRRSIDSAAERADGHESRPRRSSIGSLLHPHSSPSENDEDHTHQRRRSSIGSLFHRRSSADATEHPNNEFRKRKPGLSPNHFLGVQIKNVFVPTTKHVLGRMEYAADRLLGRAHHIHSTYENQMQKVEHLHPKQTAKIVLGLLLLVFGERFSVTFAVLEAFRHGGSDAFLSSIALLVDQARAARDAQKADEEIDEDGNGIPDIVELAAGERVRRRIRVAIKAIDPKVVQMALQNLWTSFVSATATVKVESARIFSMGLSLGNDVDLRLQRHLIPALTFALERENIDTKWVPTFTTILSKLGGVIIAFIVSPMLSVIATSSRGANLLTIGIEDLLERRAQPVYLSESEAGLLYLAALAFGVVCQAYILSHRLPIIIQLALLPLLTFEWILTFIVHAVRSDSEKFQAALGSVH